MSDNGQIRGALGACEETGDVGEGDWITPERLLDRGPQREVHVPVVAALTQMTPEKRGLEREIKIE